MSKLQKYDQIKKAAIELKATNPHLTVKEIADKLGISDRTLVKWRTDPNFHDAIHDRYMVLFGGELPEVLTALLREAKSGNVQAARLVLEFSGKLEKKINITVDSPFEKWLKKVDVNDLNENWEIEYSKRIDQAPKMKAYLFKKEQATTQTK